MSGYVITQSFGFCVHGSTLAKPDFLGADGIHLMNRSRRVFTNKLAGLRRDLTLMREWCSSLHGSLHRQDKQESCFRSAGSAYIAEASLHIWNEGKCPSFLSL